MTERRDFIKQSLIGSAGLVVGDIGFVSRSYSLGDARPYVLAKPADHDSSWISDYPMVFVGNWDAAPIYRRRVGGNSLWQESDYLEEHTEEAVSKLKDMGVTMAIIHFYKAFGLEAEKEQMQYSKKLAALCKKHGLKVGVYVGSTFGYETFLVEKPEATEWLVPDYMGQKVYYGDQTFRKSIYFQHPGYKAYIKRVLRIAVVDMKVDLIHFDNATWQALPRVFFHPMGIQHFRAFLTQKYTPEVLRKRLGFSDVRYVEPPQYNIPMSKIDDPLFQEWTDFRCRQLADYYGEMTQFIHSLNPAVVTDVNPHGMDGTNSMWNQSIDYPRLLSNTNFFWTESEKTLLSEDGLLLSKIRTYKMARSLGNRVFVTTDNPREMAECLAYNRQSIGMVGKFLEALELPDAQRRYIRFFHKNFDYYRRVDYIADVAILHSYATMSFNNDRPYQSTFLFEQSLIQGKISFDLIFDDHLKDLSRYKVLVLADQQCLSDEQLRLVSDFVHQGGGLVVTEHTSLYTEWRLRRRDFGLKNLLQLEAPLWHGNHVPEDILNVPIQRKTVGKGRVVYVPAVQPAIEKPATEAMAEKYWKLPVNHKDLITSIGWASGDDLSVHIDAPLSVTMELTKKADGSAVMLHLVNFAMNGPTVRNISVTLKAPGLKKASRVTVMTPDASGEPSVSFRQNGSTIAFTIPELSVYNMVVVQFG